MLVSALEHSVFGSTRDEKQGRATCEVVWANESYDYTVKKGGVEISEIHGQTESQDIPMDELRVPQAQH